MIGVPLRNNRPEFGKALPVQVSHNFTPASAVFDDDHLESCAGLVPVMALATQTGLSELQSRTTCCAPPACSPARPMLSREDRPCGDASSTSPPDWPDHSDDPSCTYSHTGPGHRHGSPCGTARSAVNAHHRNQSSPDHRRKAQDHHTGKAGQTSSYLLLTASNDNQGKTRRDHASSSVDRG
jgi:hypothetical protein